MNVKCELGLRLTINPTQHNSMAAGLGQKIIGVVEINTKMKLKIFSVVNLRRFRALADPLFFSLA